MKNHYTQDYSVFYTDDADKLFRCEYKHLSLLPINTINDRFMDNKLTLIWSSRIDRTNHIHFIQEYSEFYSDDFESFKNKIEKLVVCEELLK